MIQVRQQNITREIFCFKNHAKNKSGRLVPDLRLFFKSVLYEVKGKNKWSVAQFQYILMALNLWDTIKPNCIKLQTINPLTCSILILQERVWEQFFHPILYMIFQEKCFSYYILLTDQISMSDCLYFLRYVLVIARYRVQYECAIFRVKFPVKFLIKFRTL